MKGNREAPPPPCGPTRRVKSVQKPFYTLINKRPRKAIRIVANGGWQVALQSPFPSLPEDYKIYVRKQASTGLYHARQTDNQVGTIYGTGTTPDSALVNLQQNFRAIGRLLDTTTTEWYGLPIANEPADWTPVGKVFKRIGYVFILSLALYGLHSFVSLLQLL